MKALILAVAAASALAAPIAAFAQQTEAPTTRAEVRADLVQIERAGYRPGDNDSDYPRKLELAEQKVAQEDGGVNDSTAMDVSTGAGAGAALTSHHVSSVKSPAAYAHEADTRSIYFGH